VASLVQGRIVYANIPDPRGANPKKRPVIVVTPTSQLKTDRPVHVVGITSSLDQVSAADCVLLPWADFGRCVTKLSKKSAALCTWVDQVSRDKIASEDIGGIVPPAFMERILEKLETLKSQGQQMPDSPAPD
jgi:mRNA interferase MazF